MIAEGVIGSNCHNHQIIITSSSTPNECSKSSTVLDIIGGPHKYPDVLWSVVLLEVGVTHNWSNEARSVLHTMNASALVSGRSLTREEVREVKRNNDGLMTDWD